MYSTSDQQQLTKREIKLREYYRSLPIQKLKALERDHREDVLFNQNLARDFGVGSKYAGVLGAMMLLAGMFMNFLGFSPGIIVILGSVVVLGISATCAMLSVAHWLGSERAITKLNHMHNRYRSF
jgi:hypothetical protein